ncbi:hypothetical protein [Modestobacter marinus]|uniref:hypothetical protein n=1 Tax=Modestobacter marinus TaxID=477641 RepID=UPI001C946101|nr:hypothetical protein [Modestobacter marinus]
MQTRRLPSSRTSAPISRWLRSDAGQLTGLAPLVLAALGAVLALGGSVLQLLAAFPRDRHRLPAGVAASLGLVALGSVATVLHFLSPLGRALTT